MGSLPLVVHAVVVCSVPFAGGTQSDLLQRWPERRSLATSNGAGACRLLGRLLLPRFVTGRGRPKGARRAPSPATEHHDGRNDEHDQCQAKQDDLHRSDDQGGYLLSFALYTRTTSVITPLGVPFRREHLGMLNETSSERAYHTPPDAAARSVLSRHRGWPEA